MTHTWPTRAEWQANAEDYVRTLVHPRERVPSSAGHWLSPAELADVRETAHRLTTALRRIITASVRPLGKQFPDEPTRLGDRYTWSTALQGDRAAAYQRLTAGRSDRQHLNRCVRELDSQYLNVGAARLAGRDIAYVANRWNTTDTTPDAERLARLLAAMAERCDTAATEATEAAVQAEIAKRASDEGWAKELKRRADLDARRGQPIFH